jgi:2'-hydroxyisoflavone reductase
MRILVAGGSSFVGRGIVMAAVAAGHDVTMLNRGVTPTDVPDVVTRLVGDREGDLSALSGQYFDVTIDTIAYQPHQVRALAEALDGRGGFHVQISSISAYEEPAGPGATEATATLYAPDAVDPTSAVTGATYGPLKALCEYEAAQCFGDDLAIVRPTFVVGGHDKTLRFPYWVHRIAQGGTVAVPGPLENALQWIDARDLGEFTVRVAEGRAPLRVHSAVDPVSFGDMVHGVAAALGVAVSTVEIPGDVILERNLLGAFPLWAGPTGSASLAMDSTLARTHGLTARTLADSVADTAAWLASQDVPSHWLTSEDEAALVSEFA